MRKELEERLFERYPEVFRERSRTAGETAMCWGFQHGDGWFHLLDALCACLTAGARRAAMRLAWAVDGGRPEEEVAARLRELDAARAAIPAASTVKEKLGSLCFYVKGGSETDRAFVTMAEAVSRSTCESCGAPGSLREGGWLVTRCEPCWAETQRRRARRAGVPPAAWPCGCSFPEGVPAEVCDGHRAGLPPALWLMHTSSERHVRVAAGRAIGQLLGFVEPRKVSDTVDAEDLVRRGLGHAT